MNFSKRIENVQQYLIEKNIDLLIIEDLATLKYLTNVSLSKGKLFVSKNNYCLFVDGRYLQEAEEIFSKTSILSEKSLVQFIKEEEILSISFDADKTSFHSFENLNSFIKKINTTLNKNIELSPLNSPLNSLRAIKDVEEISLLKKAANINWKGFEYICMSLKEGITEKELALEYEFFVKKNGADKLSFDPIVSFGKNSAKPHHFPSNDKLKLNDIVLVDIGASYKGYHSDMTRVLFFGKANPDLEKMYTITKRAQGQALSICKPGTKIKELDLKAREVFKKEGLEDKFVHALGHGVGLDIHEFPRIKFDSPDGDVILKPGMVITIEPGLYVPGLGGTRYEDMILITEEGYENFYSIN